MTLQYLDQDAVHRLGFKRCGRGAMIHSQANIVFPQNLSLGDHVRIDGFTNIIASSDITLGSHIHIGSFCQLSGQGGIQIGNFSTLSQGVKLYSVSDDYSGRSMVNPCVPEDMKDVQVAEIVIGKHVILGSGTVVLPGVRIPDGVAVGALSLIKSDLDMWTIYAGTPARAIKARSRELLARGREIIERCEA